MNIHCGPPTGHGHTRVHRPLSHTHVHAAAGQQGLLPGELADGPRRPECRVICPRRWSQRAASPGAVVLCSTRDVCPGHRRGSDDMTATCLPFPPNSPALHRTDCLGPLLPLFLSCLPPGGGHTQGQGVFGEGAEPAASPSA